MLVSIASADLSSLGSYEISALTKPSVLCLTGVTGKGLFPTKWNGEATRCENKKKKKGRSGMRVTRREIGSGFHVHHVGGVLGSFR